MPARLACAVLAAALSASASVPEARAGDGIHFYRYVKEKLGIRPVDREGREYTYRTFYTYTTDRGFDPSVKARYQGLPDGYQLFLNKDILTFPDLFDQSSYNVAADTMGQVCNRIAGLSRQGISGCYFDGDGKMVIVKIVDTDGEPSGSALAFYLHHAPDIEPAGEAGFMSGSVTQRTYRVPKV